MKKKDLLIKMDSVATNLENLGFNKEAKAVTLCMKRVAQEASSQMLTDAFQKAGEGLHSLWNGFVSLSQAQGSAQLASLDFTAMAFLAPFEIIKHGADEALKSITSPLEAQLRAQATQLESLVNQVKGLQQSGRKQEAVTLAKSSMPQVKDIVKSLMDNLSMLSKRVGAGQYKGNTELFQQYITWGQGKTVRDVYNHALQNNSQNFANNLVALLKSKGLVTESSVIPMGFKV